MYPPQQQAYDRAITVFSPDGRLFQVEYAKEAVKRGATAIGMIFEGGVLLIAYKNANSKLLVPESMKKVFEIDNHIAATASGLIADARRLPSPTRITSTIVTYLHTPRSSFAARKTTILTPIQIGSA